MLSRAGLFIGLAFATQSATASPADIGQLIVSFDDANTPAALMADSLSERAAIELQWKRSMSGGAEVFTLPRLMTREEVDRLADAISGVPGVRYAEPDVRMYISLTPDDPQFADQWHYQNVVSGQGSSNVYGINLPDAWNTSTGSSDVVVAVIDTGILPHADIDTNVTDGLGKIIGGYDFISSTSISNDGDERDADPSDPGDWQETRNGSIRRASSWHGTHVAGTILAESNNAYGVTGVAWNSRLLAVRVLGSGGGYTSDIVDGMRWSAGIPVDLDLDGSVDAANPNPAQVLNLSLGGSGACSTTYQEAVDEIVAAGSTVVVAAGNSDAEASGYSPASCDGVIAVASTTKLGQRAYYSNYDGASPVIEIAAPGGETINSSTEGVLSTLDSGQTVPNYDDSYDWYQGTSMAAPHIAGVAALMYAVDSDITPAEVDSIMQATATPFPSYGDTADCSTATCGAGIVDTAAALSAISGSDTTPDAFSFPDKTGVPTGTLSISNWVLISGIDDGTPISIEGGYWKFNGESNDALTSEAGVLNNGDKIRIAHISSADPLSQASCTVTVGDTSETFTSITRQTDHTPEPFYFATKTGVPRDWLSISNLVYVQGISKNTPISVDSGYFYINDVQYSGSGTINPGDKLRIAHQTTAEPLSETTSSVTVGTYTTTYTTITRKN